MAMEATEKALVDLQKERPKRDAEGNLLRGINPIPTSHGLNQPI